MIRLGLVGYPLEHSLSPALHHAALQQCGLQGEYLLYPVHPADSATLYSLVDRVRDREIQGLNVTIPHKRVIMGLLDELTTAAKAIGAVNTVYHKDGKAVGHNTDFAGFRNDLLRWLPIVRSAIVLGAGGAARAVVYALGMIGCPVRVASRRMASALELEAQFPNVRATALDPQELSGIAADLLVNATPAGMLPNVDTCAWPTKLSLPAGAAVYDLVYNPAETRLIKQARAAGLRATNGLGMLIEQAALSFELWTGCQPPRQHLMDAIAQKAV